MLAGWQASWDTSSFSAHGCCEQAEAAGVSAPLCSHGAGSSLALGPRSSLNPCLLHYTPGSSEHLTHLFSLAILLSRGHSFYQVIHSSPDAELRLPEVLCSGAEPGPVPLCHSSRDQCPTRPLVASDSDAPEESGAEVSLCAILRGPGGKGQSSFWRPLEGYRFVAAAAEVPSPHRS